MPTYKSIYVKISVRTTIILSEEAYKELVNDNGRK